MFTDVLDPTAYPTNHAIDTQIARVEEQDKVSEAAIPAILDTDMWSDPDDIVALLFLLNTRGISIKLIVTGDEDEGKRAKLTKICLSILKVNIPVAQGKDLNTKNFCCNDLLNELSQQDHKERQSVDFLSTAYQIIKDNKKVLWLGIQGLTNFSEILKAHPKEVKEKVILFQMGGVIGLREAKPKGEFNFRLDPEASHFAMTQGIKVYLITANTTHHAAFKIFLEGSDLMDTIKKSYPEIYPLYKSNFEAFSKWSGFNDHRLHDPLTVLVASLYSSNQISQIMTFVPHSISVDTSKPKHAHMNIVEGNTPILISEELSDENAQLARKLIIDTIGSR